MQNGSQKQRAVILLAAGQGSRLRPLTETCPKSLLKMGQKTVLETILDSVLETGPREIVVVTGFESEQMSEFVAARYRGKDVRTIENVDYLSDTNILSAQVGVSALSTPENGYFLIETDIITTPDVWKSIIAQEARLGSFWVTRGVYGADLTGGIVQVDGTGMVTDIRYEPLYDPRFDGWPKMLGVLSVGPDEVAADIETRLLVSEQSTFNYYMVPWITYSERLPCRIFDLKDHFAMSFNTMDDYQAAQIAFASQQRGST